MVAKKTAKQKLTLCIFEDEQATNFHPLVLSRPVYDLRCGIDMLAEKIQSYIKTSQVTFHARKHLEPLIKKDGGLLFSKKVTGQTLFVNGRTLLTATTAKKMKSAKPGTAFFAGKELVGAILSEKDAKRVSTGQSLTINTKGFQTIQVKDRLAHYLWDLINLNGEYIGHDAKRLFRLGVNKGVVHSKATIVSPKQTYIGKHANVSAGAVLDASEGPVVIDDDAVVMSNAVLIGPVYVGKHSKVKVGAKIYEGTTIGPVCKIGGEVEASIIQGYSNKQHEGFLGHAYVGAWCNLGADTNNSDLKNTYGTVDVYVNQKRMDSKETFVGLFMGDHSKSGINTMFNTGTVVGFSSNVFGAGYLPKRIPSFTWFDAQKKPVVHKMEKAIETATRVMARRDMTFSAVDKKLFLEIFELTRKARKQ